MIKLVDYIPALSNPERLSLDMGLLRSYRSPAQIFKGSDPSAISFLTVLPLGQNKELTNGLNHG
jgi:hypothetical protein